MKIKDGIKTGFGITVGMTLGGVALKLVADKCKTFLKRCANDEEFMEDAKTRHPEVYEVLLKYITHD